MWRVIAAEARRSGTTRQRILQKIYDGKLFAAPVAHKTVKFIRDIVKKVRHF